MCIQQGVTVLKRKCKQTLCFTILSNSVGKKFHLEGSREGFELSVVTLRLFFNYVRVASDVDEDLFSHVQD